jgi:hypothetical protein
VPKRNELKRSASTPKRARESLDRQPLRKTPAAIRPVNPQEAREEAVVDAILNLDPVTSSHLRVQRRLHANYMSPPTSKSQDRYTFRGKKTVLVGQLHQVNKKNLSASPEDLQEELDAAFQQGETTETKQAHRDGLSGARSKSSAEILTTVHRCWAPIARSATVESSRCSQSSPSV